MQGPWRERKKRGQGSSAAVVRACTLLQSITVLASKAVWLRLDSRYPITKLVDGIGVHDMPINMRTHGHDRGQPEGDFLSQSKPGLISAPWHRTLVRRMTP